MKHAESGKRKAESGARHSPPLRHSSFIIHHSSFPRARRGLSLLEILVSLFVILVGMLSLAALLPVARYEMMVAAKADRGAACARAAMRDMVVREMLNQTIVPDSTGTGWQAGSAPLAIDPIGFSAMAAAVGAPPQFPASSIYSTPISISRATIASVTVPGPSIASRTPAAIAQRVFRWRDDLQFELPGERTERPRQQFVLPDGSVSSDLSLLASYQTADPEGAYSWMATVSPGQEPRQYVVSTVVFYNRDLTLQRELSCAVSLSGGGDVTLSVPDPAATVERTKLMELKQGDWVLLRGMKPGPPVVYAFKWYRVAALGEFAPASGSRLVTLAGPDWDTSFAPPTGMTEAGLFDRVVGVYTQTVEVDR